jgi:hypothetical protein
MKASRRRFWFAVALAVASALLAVLTLVWQTWIEGATGLEPDGGSGAFEWLVVVACLALSLAFSGVARWEWRRLQAAAPHVHGA